ncbi:DUF6207 family protein [Streptomyces tauricus]|uniref:DUF6207 family protein n=1 Tax=Streptomyces tauricus TaxID=68274 RepID=UPI00382271B4
MKPNNDAHAARPSPAVVEIAAADDHTAFAIQNLPTAHYAIAPTDRTTKDPGEPGVRLRCSVDLRQDPDIRTGRRSKPGAVSSAPRLRNRSLRSQWPSPAGVGQRSGNLKGLQTLRVPLSLGLWRSGQQSNPAGPAVAQCHSCGEAHLRRVRRPGHQAPALRPAYGSQPDHRKREASVGVKSVSGISRVRVG